MPGDKNDYEVIESTFDFENSDKKSKGPKGKSFEEEIEFERAKTEKAKQQAEKTKEKLERPGIFDRFTVLAKLKQVAIKIKDAVLNTAEAIGIRVLGGKKAYENWTEAKSTEAASQLINGTQSPYALGSKVIVYDKDAQKYFEGTIKSSLTEKEGNSFNITLCDGRAVTVNHNDVISPATFKEMNKELSLDDKLPLITEETIKREQAKFPIAANRNSLNIGDHVVYEKTRPINNDTPVKMYYEGIVKEIGKDAVTIESLDGKHSNTFNKKDFNKIFGKEELNSLNEPEKEKVLDKGVSENFKELLNEKTESQKEEQQQEQEEIEEVNRIEDEKKTAEEVKEEQEKETEELLSQEETEENVMEEIEKEEHQESLVNEENNPAEIEEQNNRNETVFFVNTTIYNDEEYDINNEENQTIQEETPSVDAHISQESSPENEDVTMEDFEKYMDNEPIHIAQNTKSLQKGDHIVYKRNDNYYEGIVIAESKSKITIESVTNGMSEPYKKTGLSGYVFGLDELSNCTNKEIKNMFKKQTITDEFKDAIKEFRDNAKSIKISPDTSTKENSIIAPQETFKEPTSESISEQKEAFETSDFSDEFNFDDLKSSNSEPDSLDNLIEDVHIDNNDSDLYSSDNLNSPDFGIEY